MGAAGKAGGLETAVVVAALDEEAEIGPALRALRAAGFSASSLWVADGGSRDATRRLARAGGARVVRCPAGRGTQFRRAARRAAESRPDVLLFLHADCRVRPGTRAALEAAFRDPSLRYACFRPRIGSPKPVYRLLETLIDFRTRATRVPYGDLGLAVRRRDYFRAGGYPDWPLFEEIRLAARLRRGGGFRRLDLPLWTSARRWRKEGLVFATLRNWTLMLGYLLGFPPAALAAAYRPASTRLRGKPA